MQSQKWQNDLCLFPRQTFNIIVIQAEAPTSNAEEAEVERFYEDLQDLLELTPKKDFYATGINNLFLIGKNVLVVMVPILINKYVFEPS